jgi:hypothetical protein
VLQVLDAVHHANEKKPKLNSLNKVEQASEKGKHADSTLPSRLGMSKCSIHNQSL